MRTEPIDTGLLPGRPAFVLLHDLRRAVTVYRARTGAMQKDVAREAGVTEEVLSRLLAAGRPDDEGPAQHDPKLSTIDRVGAVVGLRARLGSAASDPLAAALFDAVEALRRAEEVAMSTGRRASAKNIRAALAAVVALEGAPAAPDVRATLARHGLALAWEAAR